MTASPPAPLLLLFGPPLLLRPEPLAFSAERRFQLLARLAIPGSQWLARDSIAALFWPDHGAAEARRNLRKVLHDARAVPGVAGLEANDHALRWAVATDLQRLAAADADLPGLRRGPLLQGLDDAHCDGWNEWLAEQRRHGDEAWREAMLRRLGRETAAPARIELARALLRADDLDETAVAALIDAQQALGQRSEAQRSYDAYAMRIAERFGVEPARSLRERLQPAPLSAPSLAAQAPGGGFIGRRTELLEACRLLDQPECRALTLLGPGGIGKSALALRLRAQLAPRYAGGTPLADLQSAATLAELSSRLAQALHAVVDDRGDPLEQLLRQLPREPLLLVLDNAEPALGLAGWLDALLRRAPQLTLLLASRHRLQLAAERVLPLAGLAVPDEDSRDFDVASGFDAVQLFDRCARQALPGFALRREIGAVVDIVAAVGGMPLAIELAARWVRLLPPAQIAAELRLSIAPLERDPAAHQPPARPEHSSLRAVLDGSWELLAPREREALAALAVFRAGFGRAAAHAVAGAELPLLSALADKGLLGVDERGRFGLHPVVAQHALQRLAAAPETQAEVLRRHAEHQARELAALAVHLHADPRPLLQALDAGLADAVAAWRHALAGHRADLLLAMLAPLALYFEHRGRVVEGIDLLQPALALRGGDPTSRRLLARCRLALAQLQQRMGDPRAGLELAVAAAEEAAAAGDDEATIGAQIAASFCQLWLGRAVQAHALAAGALSLARALGDGPLTAWALGSLGLAHDALGRFDAARDCALQSLRLARELQDRRRIVAQWANLGQHHLNRRDCDAARDCFEHGLAEADALGYAWAQRYLRCSLGQAL
ncbi:MAG: tetratricopeptide repeat protein, partial [Rubrivivax sp.]|nr:tetratricopeptide repeat protein [Rubrivivax sp.]